jgi:hypothetical protein
MRFEVKRSKEQIVTVEFEESDEENYIDVVGRTKGTYYLLVRIPRGGGKLITFCHPEIEIS